MSKVDEAIAEGETHHLHIDFKKGDTLDDDILRLPDLEELALRNCPADLVLPSALSSLKKLREVTLTSIDDKLVLPKGLADLPLQHVGFWHVANLDDLALVKHVPSMFLVIDETKRDVALVAKHLPHLTRLEIWGSHLKSGELPPEIARFSNLEVLHLVSCGVSDLPPEILELKKLRELAMRGLPMTTLPDRVGDLASLDRLQVAGLKLNGLPASLTKLGKLRRLDLKGALNGGALLSSFDEEQFDRMKPIPRSLVEMTWLSELDIGHCGVVDAAPLRALVNLEKLDLDWSAMPALDDVGTLTKLTDLSLEHCSRVKDFGPLANLKNLRTLKMENTEPESLEFLRSLPALAELDIERVECDDMRALFDLEIPKLEASDDVLQKWKDRAALRDLPSIDDVKRDLGSDDVAVLGRALSALAKHVRAASSEDSNALAPMFGIEIESETDIVEIPALDEALEAHAKELPADAIADTFAATFLQIGNNFQAALLASEEIVRRADEELQMTLVTAFQAASEHYDAGHRYDEDTVQDQLIEKIFPKLEARPLAALLEGCGNDHLNRDGGDRMDELFAPAFSRVKDDDTWKMLTEKLSKYAADQAGYGHLEAVDKLTTEIEAAMQGAWKSKFASFLAEMRESQRALRYLAQIRADAESRDVDRIVRAITESKSLDDAKWKEMRAAFGSAVTQPGLPWDARRVVLDRLIALGDHNWMLTAAVGSLLREDAARIRKEIEAMSLSKELLAKLLRGTLIDVARLSGEDERKKGFPTAFVTTWAGEVDGISADAWRAKELAERLRSAATSYQAEQIEEAVNDLAKFSGTIDMTEKDSSYGGTIGERLADAVGQLVTYAEEPMFALSLQFHKIKLLDKTRERILAQLFGLAAANDRRDVIDAITPLLPPDVANPVLAYNLACHFAKSNDKPALLKYTARALELGKSPTQFQKDSDFAAFLEDGEFKALLERAL